MHNRPIWSGEMTPEDYKAKRLADKRAEYVRNKAKYSAREKGKYQAHKATYSARNKSYYAKNRDKVLAMVKSYRENNKDMLREKDAARNVERRPQYYGYFLQYKYGITLEQYNAMLAAQGGTCANRHCTNNGSEEKRRPRLFVDHCHETGKVRGLLCRDCNSALGLLRDSASRIRGLAAYMEEVTS